MAFDPGVLDLVCETLAAHQAAKADREDRDGLSRRARLAAVPEVSAG